MVAFCSNAVGLRRCAGSKRDEDESVPCDWIDCILDAKHPASATIGSTSSILIEPGSPVTEFAITNPGADWHPPQRFANAKLVNGFESEGLRDPAQKSRPF